MKPKELSFTIDAAQMAALTNAAVERDFLKVELGRYQAALCRKKVALTEYQKKVADQKAMLTHYQEICERRKEEERIEECNAICDIKKDEAVGAASSPCQNKECTSTHDRRRRWCKSVKICYHLMKEVKQYVETFDVSTVSDAINKLNAAWGYCPLVFDWIEEEK